MNFAKRKLARESAEAAGNADSLSNITSPDDNMDVQLTALTSEDKELDQLAKDTDTLSDDMDRTDDAIEMGEAAMENGEELSETQAAQTEIAQESIARRWCYSRTKVARESFQSKTRGATKLAVEGWKDSLKNLWKTFLELIQSFIDKIKSLGLKIRNAGKTAQARADKLDKAIDNIGAKDKDDIKGGFVEKLSIEGKFDLAASIDAAKAMTSAKGKAAIDAVQAGAESASEYATTAVDGKPSFKDASGKEVDFGTKTSSKMRVLPGMQDGDNIQPHKVQALPGNAYFQTAIKTLGDKKLTVTEFVAAGDKSEDSDVKTPDAATMRKATGGMKVIGKNFEAYVKDFENMNKAMQKLKDGVKKAYGNFDKAKDDNRDALRDAKQIATFALKNAQNIDKAIRFVGNGVLSGLNGFVVAGIAAYKKA